MAKKDLGGILTGILLSTTKSLVTSELKTQAKKFIGDRLKKSPEAIAKEVREKLGFDSENFVKDAKDRITFKSSGLFALEWLTFSPETVGRINRDEENGQIYLDGEPMTGAQKMQLVQKFSKATGIKSASVPGHFDAALKNFEVSDVTSKGFRREFGGGSPEVGVIDGWIEDLFPKGLRTDPKLAGVLFKKWMIGTARRALEPGSSHDGCFILKGPSGIGKTRFFRQILPPPFERRAGEILCDIKNPQKFLEAIVGKTVATFDELSILENPGSEETFKQLLSSQRIQVRLPWAREPRDYALRQGFAGTRNSGKFIPDEFVSRRLWVVELDNVRMRFDRLKERRAKLWKEAVHLALAGESCDLSTEEHDALIDNNKKYLKKG